MVMTRSRCTAATASRGAGRRHRGARPGSQRRHRGPRTALRPGRTGHRPDRSDRARPRHRMGTLDAGGSQGLRRPGHPGGGRRRGCGAHPSRRAGGGRLHPGRCRRGRGASSTSPTPGRKPRANPTPTARYGSPPTSPAWSGGWPSGRAGRRCGSSPAGSASARPTPRCAKAASGDSPASCGPNNPTFGWLVDLPDDSDDRIADEVAALAPVLTTPARSILALRDGAVFGPVITPVLGEPCARAAAVPSRRDLPHHRRVGCARSVDGRLAGRPRRPPSGAGRAERSAAPAGLGRRGHRSGGAAEDRRGAGAGEPGRRRRGRGARRRISGRRSARCWLPGTKRASHRSAASSTRPASPRVSC